MALTPEEQAELDELEQDTELQTYLTNLSKPKEEVPETGMLEAGVRSFAQGLTGGFSDEATAALESALTPKPYEQALKESQAEYKAGEEQYPITSTVGDIAGGLTQAVGLSVAATPAAGAAAGAGRFAKAAQLMKSVLNPTTKAGFLKNVGTGALAGAAQGAIQAVGRSEKQGLERLKEAPGGALSGAATGGVLTGALGAAGAGLKKAGEVVSKGIDEGKYPTVFRMIRQGARTGLEGRGFAKEVNLDKSLQEAFDVAENVVRPEIADTLADLRQFRESVLEGSDAVMDLSDIVKRANKDLKLIADPDSEKFRQNIKKAYENAVNVSQGNITPGRANAIAKEIKDFIAENPDLPAKVKKIGYAAANDIKNQIRKRIPDDEAMRIISKDPAMLAKYRKYIRDISDEDLSLTLQDKFQISDKEAKKKAKDIKQIVKTIGAAFSDEDPEAVSSIMQSPEMQEQFSRIISLTSPIKTLDDKMHRLLNASEIMGDVINGRSEAESLDDIIKIFKNIVEQPKDSTSAFLAREQYKRAMDNIKQVSPEIANKIEKKITPILENIKYQRYIMGEGFEKGSKDSGIIRGVVGDVGKLAAEGANLAAQTLKAGAEGKAGPLPLTSTILRPTTSVFQSAKQVVDDVLQARPDSKVWQTISDTLEKALNEKDENRRAALLNTLMQYESFRNIITPFKKD
jgi:hypothetical protein